MVIAYCQERQGSRPGAESPGQEGEAMTELEELIQWWQSYLAIREAELQPPQLATILSTIKHLKELKKLREQSSGGEKE